MHEHILGAIIRLDETKALLGVEEFHSSDGHHGLLSRFVAVAATSKWLRNNPGFGGIHFEKQPQRSGACQQGEAENPSCGRENIRFASNVNGSTPDFFRNAAFARRSAPIDAEARTAGDFLVTALFL
jgi:hypothetical protein